MRDAKSAYGQLAQDACNLVHSIVVICKPLEGQKMKLPEDLDHDMQSLLQWVTCLAYFSISWHRWSRTLEDINQFAQKQVSRGSIERFVMQKQDVGKVQEYRLKLGQALNIFTVCLPDGLPLFFLVDWYLAYSFNPWSTVVSTNRKPFLPFKIIVSGQTLPPTSF